jgi:DNA-binding IscR family transcriptional regulator
MLDALRELKATDPEKLVTGQEIADEVGGDTTCQSVKAPLADLKHRGLVDSKTGRMGGTWLTPEGLKHINLLRPKQ